MSFLSETAIERNARRKTNACNECRRRKVRCSGEEQCTNCVRDGKDCIYHSAQQKISELQRRLHRSQNIVRSMEKAWQIHLPDISMDRALRGIEDTLADNSSKSSSLHAVETEEATQTRASDEVPQPSPAESSNAEDFEFDESQDFDDSTDGMGSLVIEPQKAGYMGPQSGVSALKFLQTLQLNVPFRSLSPVSSDEPEESSMAPAQSFNAKDCIDDYFSMYHTAYPILHEGTFRARVSGALAKPRDGSWPLLYNIVLAIGAFVGDMQGTKRDIRYYRLARQHLNMDILEKGSLSYVQALILMANYLQKRNKPNSGFILIGIGFSMALAIGLHREFVLPSSTPFTMELRRRAWWTLFVFVSGAQLTLGRPAVSLVGVNLQTPRNLDDDELAVDMEGLPEAKDGPTSTSCLIHQVRLAQVANLVQVELLTNQIPSIEAATSLDKKIVQWRKDLPGYFDEQQTTDDWFEVPKRILIWRSFHLRIVLNRPILFKAISAKEKLVVTVEPINTCLTAAGDCVEAICSFIESGVRRTRGLAWYATYWLITASFVQATCYSYNPTHNHASLWKAHLERAVTCLTLLGPCHQMAFRARDILKKLLCMDFWGSESGRQHSQPQHESRDVHMAPFYGTGDNPFFWYTQGSSEAELLDAAGGIMLQNYADSTGTYSTGASWMPNSAGLE